MILIILAAIILFSVFKSVLKAALSLTFLIFIALLVIGFLFVQDSNNFRKTYFQKPSIYILENNDVLITAFSMVALNISSFKPVSVNDATDYFTNEGPNKVFVINKAVLNASVDDELFKLTGFGFENSLASNNNDIRASAFVLSFIETIKNNNKMYIIKQIRKNKMLILPRTFAVKVITFDAKGYFEKIKKIINNQKDNVENIVNVINETKTVLNSTL